MSDKPPVEGNLADEFTSLGKNLLEVIQAAWESPERRRVQQEIEQGLNELGNTLSVEAENFKTSPTGQQLKADVEELEQRIRSGETQAKIQQELLAVLQTANSELQKVIQKWSTSQSGADQASPPSANSGTEG
ncbi:MAG: hypothetical protein AB1894_28905 [Chloroflexota bacterium]